MVPYSQINPNAALPEAFSCVGLHWVSYIVILGAVCGMTTSLLGSLFSLPRCLYAMAEDGLIFKFFANIDKRSQVRRMHSVVLFLKYRSVLSVYSRCCIMSKRVFDICVVAAS